MGDNNVSVKDGELTIQPKKEIGENGEVTYTSGRITTQGKHDFPAPFDQPFYIILNVAVGGDWPGDPSPDTVFDDSVSMKVDYVRVYQREAE